MCDVCVVIEGGEKHGAGHWVGESGDRYEGEWQHGRRHGKGKYSWRGDNGSADAQYEGQWVKVSVF